MSYDGFHYMVADVVPQNACDFIMSDNRNSDNSLEREIEYEDATLAAGKRSQERRIEVKEDKKKKEEEKRQVEMKEAMINAGKNSREKRGKN